MDSIDKMIHLGRIKKVLENQLATCAVSLVLSTVFYSAFYNSSSPWVHTWIIVHVITIVIRLAFLSFYYRNKKKLDNLETMNLMENIYCTLVTITCIAWGVTPTIFMDLLPTEYIPLAFAMFFGVIIGGVSRSDNSSKLSTAYIFGFLVPFSTFGITYPNKPNIILVVFSFILLGFLYSSLRKQYSQYLANARLAEDNKSMANDLQLLLDVEKELQKEKAMNFHNAKLVSIGELASGVAHEINNPLTIASGYILAIKNKGKDKIPQELLEKMFKIENALTRISVIVRNLKNLSRNEHGSSRIFSLSKTLEDSIDFVNEIYAKTEINIKVEIQQDIMIDGRSGEIQQVILNLLSNAKDALASKNSNKIIKVKLERIEEKAILMVEDNGIGVPTNLKKNIFDPFFTTKEVNKGTGLGLSISHNIMTEHNGRIDLESEINQFTRFTLFFPIPKSIEKVA